jgi:hypothetical protein
MFSDGEYSDAEVYDVERIVNKSLDNKGKPIYLVKWTGYPDKCNTWEPIENLTNVKAMVKNFDEQLNKKKGIVSKVQSVVASMGIKHIKQANYMSSTGITYNSYNTYQNKVEKPKAKAKTALIDLTSDTNSDYGNYSNKKIKQQQPFSFMGNPDDNPDDLKANLEYDTPLCVKRLQKSYNGPTMVEVEWNQRSDGMTPNNELVLYQKIKDKFPEVLIQFYEERLLTNKTKLTHK